MLFTDALVMALEVEGWMTWQPAVDQAPIVAKQLPEQPEVPLLMAA